MEFNGTFLVAIITFIVFVFIMNKILYAPILGIMEQRENFINSNYKDADENKVKANVLNVERAEKLNGAKDDARERYLERVGEFKTQKEGIISDAQKEAGEELEKSRENLKNVSDEVKQNLKGSMNELANDIVEKVIGYRTEIEGFEDSVVDKVLWGQDS